MWTKRRVIASIIVGLFGAVIGASGGSLGTYAAEGEEPESLLATAAMLIAAVISFVVCFLLSVSYLKVIENRSWVTGLWLGPLSGGLAGAISGFVSGFALSIGVWHESLSYSPGMFGVPLWSTGVQFGLFMGLASGLLLAMLAAPFLLKYLTGYRGSSVRRTMYHYDGTSDGQR